MKSEYKLNYFSIIKQEWKQIAKVFKIINQQYNQQKFLGFLFWLKITFNQTLWFTTAKVVL